MRLITLDKAVEITTDMFNDYVEHVGMSLMCGEVPSIMFTVHRRGTKEKDWLAHVRFKNTLAISVFKCEVWLDDIFRFCRLCKLYLITEEVFRVAILYAMLHPLYQSQFIDFKLNVDADYDSMMHSAGKATHKFIKDYYQFEDSIENVVLDVLSGFMLDFTNRHTKHTLRNFLESQDVYRATMMSRYPGAYRVARFRKAQTMLVNDEGFVLLEPRTEGGTKYYVEGNAEDHDEKQEREGGAETSI